MYTEYLNDAVPTVKGINKRNCKKDVYVHSQRPATQ